MILEEFSPKIKDPSNFSIPCMVGRARIDRPCVILVQVLVLYPVPFSRILV